MEKQTLLIALQELTKQKTPDGIQEVLQRYPELVTESTILTLRELATQATTKDDPQSSRFFDEMATWLQGLAAELTASAVSNNPTIQVVKQVLAGEIELDTAFIHLRLPDVTSQYNDNVMTMLDNLVWNFREKGQPNEALIVARLNFEAARSHPTSELKKYAGVTLLQNMPTERRFAKLRAHVCEITVQWLTDDADQELWASILIEYGNALLEIDTGNKEENIERAIDSYQAALEIRTPTAMPQHWATTMLNLGSAYVKRRRGEPQENQERAIEIFREALEVFTRETTPDEWATAMNALGVVYLDRISGNNADNIEQAINFLESCLQVHTLEDFPLQWAMAENNLGVAYLKRTRGDSAENKELSIQHHEAALRIYTVEDFPVDWAMTNHNLGIALTHRLRGDTLANLKQAIACFNSALEVRTHDSLPYEWAKTMAQLGLVYIQRLPEIEDLEKAIECYNVALEIITLEVSTDEWAKVMTGLGVALLRRKSGEPADNIEQAIKCFEECLTVRTREQFPSDWAEIQSHLGAAFFKRIQGEKAESLETAIAYFEAALTVRTRNEFPEEWAMAMMNLGAAYGKRIRGAKSRNLEKSIACLESALEVHTFETYPDEWLITMDNLGLAYRERITGNRAANLERAIECFQGLLRVRTREALPLDWAKTTTDLGITFAERIYGDKGTNIERAIECCQAALEVATRDSSAWQWALTTLNLGAIYGDRVVGKRTQNLEVAIEDSKAALQVLMREAFPQEWGLIMYNLGNNYRNRILGDHAENLERAIEYYEASLQVRTPETAPELWAMSMHSLGTTYYFRIYGKRSENIERAIECYSTTLRVRTREAYPREWARATHDLGLAFADREKDDLANNIDQAIKFIEDAATVHTREAFPHEWIMEMHGLGDAYVERVHGDRDDNLDRAIEYYNESLQVFTREALPQQWARTMLQLGIAFSGRSRSEGLADKKTAIEYLRKAADAYLELGLPYETNQSFSTLGDVAFELEQYEDAINAYSQALETVESIRAETFSLKRRAEIMQANNRLFDRSIIALMKLDRELPALELAERGKSRTLSDLLTLRDLRPKNTSAETLDQYEEILFRVRALEDLLRAANINPVAQGKTSAENAGQQVDQLRRELLDAQRQLEDLVNVIRQQDKDFLPHAQPLTIESIRRLARDANSTLILFRITEAGSFVFLIFPDGQTDVVRVPKFTTDHLNQLLIRLDDDGSARGWAFQYYVYKSVAEEDGESRQAAFQSWLDTMDSMLGDVYDQLLKPVRELLRDKLGQGVASLVMIPNRGLSILPLHACWWNEHGDRRYLLDDFIVRYAPSLSVFQRCVERERAGRKKDTVLGIANPMPPGNLTFSELECAEIEELFGNDRCLILSREEATKDAVLQHCGERNWLHFSCHAQFQLDAPFESSLLLARREKLSLAEILEQLDLRHTWLAVLSACETGLVDFREISDEHYGLPIGFLFAGAPTVWGTLWRVSDLTTALLMIKAYEGLITGGKSKAQAIREAQLWLRDMTASDLQELTEERQTRSGADAKGWSASTRANETPRRPFAHPYYWAAMQSIGA